MKHMRNRRVRTTAVISAVGVVSMLIAGCGSPQPTTGGASEPLDFYSLAWQPAAAQSHEDIVAAWNEANPDHPVNLVAGAWGAVKDALLTGFAAGTAPDIIHYEGSAMRQFAAEGYLLNLDEHLSPDFVASILPDAWATAQYSEVEGTYGVPFLQEPYVVIANKTALDEAGVVPPTIDNPWTWDDYREVARTLTGPQPDGKTRYGASFPLKNGGFGSITQLGANFGAGWFVEDGDGWRIQFGDAEAEIPRRLNEMLNVDKTMPPEITGLSIEDQMPLFYDGQIATFITASYVRESIRNGAPDDLDWIVLPPLKGLTQEASNVAQTISVNKSAHDVETAVAFTEFFLSAENQVRLAAGDWLTPTSVDALKDPTLTQAGDGWDVVLDAATSLRYAPLQSVTRYLEFEQKVGTPAFSAYFAGEISLDELKNRLVEEGDPILAR